MRSVKVAATLLVVRSSVATISSSRRHRNDCRTGRSRCPENHVLGTRRQPDKLFPRCDSFPRPGDRTTETRSERIIFPRLSSPCSSTSAGGCPRTLTTHQLCNRTVREPPVPVTAGRIVTEKLR
jgi:hypothetical protein